MAHKPHEGEDARRAHFINRRDALKVGAAGVALGAAGGALSSCGPGGERVSTLGVYKGYSKEAYDGWVRTSQYVPVRDGVKLAVDLYRPTAAKALHKERLPVVWQAKRYQRAIVQPDGSLTTLMGSSANATSTYASRTAQTLIRNGFIVASVDRRGSGASFGTRSEQSDPVDATDGYDITEWLAKQPWCTGQIGMFGASYEGEVQLRIAATAPPHLKAIMPEVAPFDWYWTVSPGGIHRTSQGDFATMLAGIDANPNNGPVDDDKDRSQLMAALAQHKAGNDYSAPAGKLPFRDSKNPVTGERNWLTRHGGHYAEGLSKSGVAVYHRIGWFSNVGVHEWAWFVAQKAGPKKMLVGPWGVGSAVTEEERAQWTAEALRWFDYWLKGVKNGIMEEPPIYSSMPSSHTRNGAPFRGLPTWPLPNEQRTEYFFEAGKSGSIQSANDGKLVRAKPASATGRDDYKIRYDIAFGKRGANEPAGPGESPIDFAASDAKGLTYTTEPLEAEVEVTGHPVVRLWVSSSAKDGDFFVKLEDVDPAGVSTYVAQGMLRASHRAVGKPPYDFFGVPWNTSYEADVRPMPKGEPAELNFPMFPTSYLYKRGHRIRVTITGSDLTTGPSPTISPAPVIGVHRSASHASSVTLPIIPTGTA